MDEEGSISEFYKGKDIFLTGGTGFIGKALIEKLLRSCPELKHIYVLVRPKKGKFLEERIEQILDSLIFESLKSTNPEVFKKLIPINGDVTQLGLGLSDEDRKLLTEKISIVFHAAASVKFDDFLKDSVFVNLRSAREIALLSLEMKNVKVFLHVSTTFCNIDNKTVIEEILYPPHGNWKEAITVAEQCDSRIFDILSPKYTNPFPNTYTYTKQLAENCINDLLVGNIPTVIFRPSVVISSVKEPYPGWIDNFNGPVGLLIAGGCGILRSVYGDRDIETDYVSIDNVVKCMIVAAWDKAFSNNASDLSIISCSRYKLMPIKVGNLIEMGKRLRWDVPFEKKIWFPGPKMTKCWYDYYVNVILLHVIPAIFIDLSLRIAGHKPMLLKLQRKIYVANMAISYFALNRWDFINTNALKLWNKIPEKDIENFNYLVNPYNAEELYEYYKDSCNMARCILLKEDRQIKPQTFINTKRMYYLDMVCRIIFYGLSIWLIFFKVDICRVLFKILQNYWNSI